MSKPTVSADKIREHWSQEALKHGAAPTATTPDRILRDMEIDSILKYLEGEYVLDLGCGNGFSTLQFAGRRPGRYLGADYSQEMIAAAEAARPDAQLCAGAAIAFQVADATALPFADATFDSVTTDRCLINLVDLEAQRRALAEICRVIKPGGRYVMCENSQQALARLNHMRELAGLPTIGTRWHNVYLDEEALASSWNEHFRLELVDNFSSLYYLASRIFNAKLAQELNQEPDYNHPLNQLAARLPSCGDIGPLKIFVFRKP